MVNQRVQAVAVALFVLVIAGVVAVLLSRVDREPPAASGSTSPVPDDADSAAEDPIGRVSIEMGRGDLVLRVMAGSCSEPGGPRLELSENRGRTFHRVRLPQVDDGSGVSASSPTVRAIVYADAASPAEMTVGAADDDCEVHPYTTTDGGGTWQQGSGPLQEWHIDPATGGIVSPTGPTDSGCKSLAAMAPVSKTAARAFCTGGTVRGTSSGGAQWTDLGQLPDVTAAAFSGPRTGFAAVAERQCKSRIHATADGGLTWRPVGCVADEFVIQGLSANDRRLVGGGAGGVRVSPDDGRTWKAPAQK